MGFTVVVYLKKDVIAKSQIAKKNTANVIIAELNALKLANAKTVIIKWQKNSLRSKTNKKTSHNR